MDHSDLMYERHGQEEGLTREQHDILYGFAYMKGHASGEHEVEVEVEYKDALGFAIDLLATKIVH